MQKPAVESRYESRIAHLMEKIGPQQTVQRFIARYGKPSTKATYLIRLELYLRWLKDERGDHRSPDELINDNLACVFRSEPTDVRTKRKHTDLLFDFVNDYMVRRGRRWTPAPPTRIR